MVEAVQTLVALVEVEVEVVEGVAEELSMLDLLVQQSQRVQEL